LACSGQRFRAGIEGRISVLFRGRGMKRCLAEGRERFEMWVAAAVLANNLMKVADLLMQRSSHKRKAAQQYRFNLPLAAERPPTLLRRRPTSALSEPAALATKSSPNDWANDDVGRLFALVLSGNCHPSAQMHAFRDRN
jgi:hypothetical protein